MKALMPQLREDPTIKEWIIIASERSKRPHDFKKNISLLEKPPYKVECPFCPGNAYPAPHESSVYFKNQKDAESNHF
jgi:UDPglucose--hexose-1-phosphate uridylyltransferase